MQLGNIYGLNTSSTYDMEEYKKDLIRRREKHLKNILNQLHGRPCMHDACTECCGTGVRSNGSSCIHNISCPCPRCSPVCY